MKVLLFGATGMVGQGVLRECSLASDVTEIASMVRTPTASLAPKVREIVAPDMYDLSAYKADFAGVDACFFCLGVSSAGMKEDAYTKVTYDLTLSAARTLHEVSPDATFIYVSGQSTDSSEQGKSMWARVKGKTENDLMKVFTKAYMFRPGIIRALHGVRPRNNVYRYAYAVLWPIIPVIKLFAPGIVLDTEKIGLAMLAVARKGAVKNVLEVADINRVLGQA
jgi:uncharacterized protein YbjT (DUF2867 family)